MFYVKNVPNRERMLRIVAGGAAIGLTVLGGSGLFGFCPMCAMVGRRLAQAARQAAGPR